MRFQFRLEGLLRVRRLLERQARGRLDESLLCVQGLEHSLAEAAAWKQQTVKLRSAQKLLPAAEVQFIESTLRQTDEAIRQCQLRKQAEEQRAAELRAAYLNARRERKTVSTLRENALRQFQVEQLRRDQRDLDELYLGKLIYSRHAPETPGSSSTESDSVDDRNLT
jgi:flagellar export protein FliJ